MSQEKDMFWLIEDYVKGSLSKEERGNFETELVNDKDLQAKVEIARLSQLALQRQKLWEVKNLFIAVDKEERQKAIAKKVIGGSVGAVLLVAGLVYLISVKEEASAPKSPTVIAVPSSSPASKVEIPISVPSEPKVILPSNKIENVVESKKSQTVSSPIVKVKEIPVAPSILPAPQETLPVSGKQVEKMIPTLSAEKPKETTKVESICVSVHIEAYTAIENACVDDHNGKILVSGLKGGKAPYDVKIRDEAKQRVPEMHLAAGKYAITITDQQGCTKVLEGLQVKEEDCKKNYELNASNGDVLEIGTATTAASLSIYDKAGNLYLYKLFGQGEEIKWDGNSTKGEALTGYFIFTVTYQDGKVKRGSITVMR